MIPRSIIEYTLIICLIALLVVGCDDPNLGKSSKRMAQEKILHELDTCDSKFGTDSSDRRQMSRDYCAEVLDKVNTLIKEGYFEGDDETREIIKNVGYNESEKDSIADEQKQAKQELDSTINEIIGDI